MLSKSKKTCHGSIHKVQQLALKRHRQQEQRGDDMDDSDINVLLPNEILSYISLLPPPDLKAAVMVCKLWAEVGQAPELWTWVNFKVCQDSVESMPERIQRPRMKEVNLMRIEACYTSVSINFMVAVAMHSGLGTVLVSNHYQYPCALDHCSYHCVWWEKIFSNVPPALFGQAFSNLQKIRLEGAGLSVDQLNTFCTVIASDATTKEYLELDDNRLWDVQPSLLAQAVIKFRLVILDRGWKRCAKNFVAHGVALFNALGESSSCTSHLSLTGFDLSGVDPGVMAKQVLKLRVCYLNTAGLTTEQSSAITNAVTDDNSNLYHLKINSGTGSNTRTQLIFAVGNIIRELNIDIWRL